MLFLLTQKDRYGVWYSSQASINVLDALLAVLGAGSTTGSSPVAEVIVNGQKVKSVELPAAGKLTGPLSVDLSSYLTAGSNKVEVRTLTEASLISLQAVASYYIPWSASDAKAEENSRAGGSSGLRLVTRFDRTTGKINEEITCHVEAERVAFRGYGMLLAEVGLPPGADVDRASLDTAMKGSGWAINQYDILPDRGSLLPVAARRRNQF